MSLNVDLLQRIKAHILEEPKRYDQRSFGHRWSPDNGGPACGTVACIAGWAVELSGEKLLGLSGYGTFIGDVPERARKLIGLTIEDNATLGAVFGSGVSWPQPFGPRLLAAVSNDDKKAAAQVAADYIDFIIATKGENTNES